MLPDGAVGLAGQGRWLHAAVRRGESRRKAAGPSRRDAVHPVPADDCPVAPKEPLCRLRACSRARRIATLGHEELVPFSQTQQPAHLKDREVQ